LGLGAYMQREITGYRKSKLKLRRDGSFKLLQKVNAYKVDIQGKYNVSAI
jgi:hypothetical protein